MWTMLDRPVTTKLTKKLAKEWADLPAIPHDRPLSDRRLEVYAQAIKEGTFRSPTWAKCLCGTDNQIYRINGKHTSLLLSKVEPLPDLFVIIESYTCDDISDLPKLYATFDSRQQTRSNTDIVHTFAASVPELAALPGRINQTVASALGYAIWGINSYSRAAADRGELLTQNVDFTLWFYETLVCDNSNNRILFRSPVVAAVYLTWLKNKKDAATFWLGVQNEDAPDPNDATRVLARFLATWAVSHGKGSAHIRSRQAQPREFFVKCIHAWNAWRKGEKTTLKYYVDKDLPKIL